MLVREPVGTTYNRVYFPAGNVEGRKPMERQSEPQTHTRLCSMFYVQSEREKEREREKSTVAQSVGRSVAFRSRWLVRSLDRPREKKENKRPEEKKRRPKHGPFGHFLINMPQINLMNRL